MRDRIKMFCLMLIMVLFMALLYECPAIASPEFLSPSEHLDAVGTASIYKVVAIKGNILAWRSMGTKWESLMVGQRVVAGTLIQSNGPAELMMQRMVIKARTAGDQTLSMNMRSATMIRIEDQLNRPISVSNFIMKGDALSKVEGYLFDRAHQKDAYARMPSAWERLKMLGSSLMNMTEDPTLMVELKDVQRAIKTDQTYGTIEIKSPTDGGDFIVDGFPTYLPLSWEPKNVTEKISNVEIYLRRDQDSIDRLVTRTNVRSMPLQILEPGIYQISIVVPELGIQSPEIAVSVEGVVARPTASMKSKKRPASDSFLKP